MYELKRTQYKTIWLNTSDAVIDTERKTFTYNNLPLIKVIGEKNILKVNSITLSGPGVSNITNSNWTVKIKDVKFNNTTYFNSDKDLNPTIAEFNYDSNNTIQNGLLSLELEKQDINLITLQVYNDDNNGLKISNDNIDLHICIVICEEFFDL
jgi:hypothetical protein